MLTGIVGGRARPYLELVRVPNLFTAVGDVLAGYLVVTRGAGADWSGLLLLVAASVALYAGGVVLNDYFDRDVDRVERPERPIPSGRVAPGTALGFGAVLLALGCLLAAVVGAPSAATAAILAGAILLYDARGKRIPYLGSVNMGACRFLNVLLGASGAAASVDGWLAAGIPFASIVLIYIAAVTLLSTGEVWGGSRLVAAVVFGVLAGVVLAIPALALADRLASWAYVPFLVAFGLATLSVVGRVVLTPSASNIRRAIKVCILSLLLLDAAFAAGAAGLPFGILTAALIIPSILTARLFAVT